ncbi:MAG: DNA translocase FtsK [Sphaerochaetaceae bacterium]|nr:DNA translocase FtsK [Sphaerochaetaceae bacterium]
MKVQRFSLILALLCALLGIATLLPAIMSPDLFATIPFHSVIEHVVSDAIVQTIPTIIGENLLPYALPAIFFGWALFFVIMQKRPFFWWMAPYSALMIYTLFIFSQLLNRATTPAYFMMRLSREPKMGLLLIILAMLLELTIFMLFTIISARLNRRYREKQALLARQNKRKKGVVAKPIEERVEVTETSPTLDRSDPALTFPPIKELPKLKTIGNDNSALYVGSVKVREDDSVLVTDTPLDDLDEPSEVPEGKMYDPIPSLRKQIEKDATVDSIVVPTVIPDLPKTGVTENSAVEEEQTALPAEEPVLPTEEQEKVQEPPKKVSVPLEEPPSDDDEKDMEQISGVGGLISSDAGPSALLTRNKLRYNYPPADLLEAYPNHVTEIDEETRAAGENLIQTLKQFKVEATLMNIVKGPTVTMFEVSPAPGVRVSAIISLSDNIALQLAARQVRIVAPIPGKQAVGIEVPNKRRSIIGFKDLLPSIDDQDFNVPMVLGRKITGEPVVIEITQTPHLLIAGATGSGKSVCVNSFISSILFRRSPKEVRLILVDPKIVELRVYNGIPHLLTPVITEPKKTIKALEFCLYEMERRYKLLNALAVRNIAAYNKKIQELKLARERLPYIVVIIDEFADLMNTVGKELETMLARLAAMARAIGIHLVLATQRPSANVITGIIKSNIPTRIAFMVASQIDSRIIIDETGAEKLLGRGDMLFAPAWDPNSARIQGAFLSDEEVERIVAYAKTQGEPDYLDEAFFEDDDTNGSDDDDEAIDDNSDEALFEKALKIVVERQSASASFLQRRLRIGYNRAARLIEQMEDEGYVGPPRGSKPREILRFPD